MYLRHSEPPAEQNLSFHDCNKIIYFQDLCNKLRSQGPPRRPATQCLPCCPRRPKKPVFAYFLYIICSLFQCLFTTRGWKQNRRVLPRFRERRGWLGPFKNRERTCGALFCSLSRGFASGRGQRPEASQAESFASLESQPRELHVAVRSYLGAAFAIALPRLSAFAEEGLDHPPREFQPWKPKQGVCGETKIALYVEKFKLVIRYQSDRLKPQIYQNKRKGHVSYSKILYNHNS